MVARILVCLVYIDYSGLAPNFYFVPMGSHLFAPSLYLIGVEMGVPSQCGIKKSRVRFVTYI